MIRYGVISSQSICDSVKEVGVTIRWVFVNGPGDLGSISGWVIPKTQKIVLDTSLLNTQQYKAGIKGKVEQSLEGSSALGVVAIEKGAFGSPSTKVTNFTLLLYTYLYLYISNERKRKRACVFYDFWNMIGHKSNTINDRIIKITFIERLKNNTLGSASM